MAVYELKIHKRGARPRSEVIKKKRLNADSRKKNLKTEKYEEE